MSTSTSRRLTNNARPSLERLEDRQLLAASASLLSGGVLRVTGTEGNDTIVVRQIDNRISIDGVGQTYAVALVKRVEVNALGGNDRVYLNSESVSGQQALSRRATVWAGAGDDLIVGGAAGNELQGGDGNDTIYGSRVADLIFSQAGNDRIFCMGGDDTAYGGDGSDEIRGGTGNDRLFGELGADMVYGEAGNDQLDGGMGNDFLDGGIGQNTIRGGGGRDQIAGTTGITRSGFSVATVDPNSWLRVRVTSFEIDIVADAGYRVGKARPDAILTAWDTWQGTDGQLWVLVTWESTGEGTIGIMPESMGTTSGWVKANFLVVA